MRALAPIVVALLAAACHRAPPSDGLREWSADDHDRGPDDQRAAQQGPKGDAGGPAVIIQATWRTQCAACHGAIGKGDGPQGPMFKAPDLTREEFQSSVKDAEIAAVITNGKGRMPKFDLPEPVVAGLVARIRASRGR